MVVVSQVLKISKNRKMRILSELKQFFNKVQDLELQTEETSQLKKQSAWAWAILPLAMICKKQKKQKKKTTTKHVYEEFVFLIIGILHSFI